MGMILVLEDSVNPRGFVSDLLGFLSCELTSGVIAARYARRSRSSNRRGRADSLTAPRLDRAGG